jgi:hypothetical protein
MYTTAKNQTMGGRLVSILVASMMFATVCVAVPAVATAKPDPHKGTVETRHEAPKAHHAKKGTDTTPVITNGPVDVVVTVDPANVVDPVTGMTPAEYEAFLNSQCD